MNRRRILVSIAVLGLACHEPTTASNPTALSPGSLRLHGGIAFDAEGAPAFKDTAVVPATFAVAILDSVSGPYILAFNARDDGEGDFFILGLNAARTGSFGPCADGPSTVYPDGSVLTLAGACQGRLLEGVTTSGMVMSSRDFLQSVGGTVTVQSVGDRLVGTVANLRLTGIRRDGSTADVSITTGEFDLPLLRGNAARAMSSCFLPAATGRQCGY